MSAYLHPEYVSSYPSLSLSLTPTSAHQMTRQHSAPPTNSRIEYRSEIRRLNEANAQLTTEAQELKDRVAYLEKLAISWADQNATTQYALSNAETRADNATSTWLVTRTWLDETQASLTIAQQELAATRNELHQSQIERSQLYHALALQTQATSDAVNAERVARQEVAAMNHQVCRITDKWDDLVYRLDKEAAGRQRAEEALTAERQYHQESREIVTEIIEEKVELVTELEMTRDKNDALIGQLDHMYGYLDKVERYLAQSKEGTTTTTVTVSPPSSSSPPPLTDSDGSSSSDSSPLPATSNLPFSQSDLDRATARLEDEGFTLMGEDPEEIDLPSLPLFVRDPPVVVDSETGLKKRYVSLSSLLILSLLKPFLRTQGLCLLPHSSRVSHLTI